MSSRYPAIDRSPYRIRVGGHVDRQILKRSIDLGQQALMELGFELGELQAMCSTDDNDSCRCGNHAGFDQLDRRRESNSRLRIVEKSEPVHFCTGIDQLGFGRLLHDALGGAQRLDGLPEANWVADLDR